MPEPCSQMPYVKEDPMPKYMRVKQAAEFLSISVDTLRDWMRKRIIPFRKIGGTILLDPDELVEAVDRFRRASLFENEKSPIGRRR